MKDIVIITSNSIRHNYFKILFSRNNNINTIRTYVETDVDFQLKESLVDKTELSDKSKQHFIARHNTEYDFFSDVICYCKDKSNSKYIKKGEINTNSIVEEIIHLNPDLIITYGCSIIKAPLLDAFKNRIINVHLGLSPYYFGSGTNFFCLVNDEFQFEGYTFMYMDKGVDTGSVIHQSRAKIFPFDNPHQIGNRLIKKMTLDFIKLVINFDLIKKKDVLTDYLGKTYKNKDATSCSILRLYDNFNTGSVIKFLEREDVVNKQYPIVEQDFLK